MIAILLKKFTYPVAKRVTQYAPWIASFGLFAAVCGVGFGVFFTSPDYHQGEVFKIIYMHVPASWMAMMMYMMMALSFLFGIVAHQKYWLMLGRSLILPGSVFCALSLVSGALWGKPTWGAYWVWDARLTSMLILFFIYIGVGQFCNSRCEKDLKTGAILGILGAINLPIIKWSVTWWFTLHQPQSISLSLKNGVKNAIHGDYMTPLLVCFVGFFIFGVGIALKNFENILQNFKKHRPIKLDKSEFAPNQVW